MSFSGHLSLWCLEKAALETIDRSPVFAEPRTSVPSVVHNHRALAAGGVVAAPAVAEDVPPATPIREQPVVPAASLNLSEELPGASSLTKAQISPLRTPISGLPGDTSPVWASGGGSPSPRAWHDAASRRPEEVPEHTEAPHDPGAHVHYAEEASDVLYADAAGFTLQGLSTQKAELSAEERNAPALAGMFRAGPSSSSCSGGSTPSAHGHGVCEGGGPALGPAGAFVQAEGSGCNSVLPALIGNTLTIKDTVGGLSDAADAECWARLREQLQSLHQNVQDFASKRVPPPPGVSVSTAAGPAEAAVSTVAAQGSSLTVAPEACGAIQGRPLPGVDLHTGSKVSSPRHGMTLHPSPTLPSGPVGITLLQSQQQAQAAIVGPTRTHAGRSGPSLSSTAHSVPMPGGAAMQPQPIAQTRQASAHPTVQAPVQAQAQAQAQRQMQTQAQPQPPPQRQPPPQQSPQQPPQQPAQPTAQPQAQASQGTASPPTLPTGRAAESMSAPSVGPVAHPTVCPPVATQSQASAQVGSPSSPPGKEKQALPPQSEAEATFAPAPRLARPTSTVTVAIAGASGGEVRAVTPSRERGGGTPYRLHSGPGCSTVVMRPSTPGAASSPGQAQGAPKTPREKQQQHLLQQQHLQQQLQQLQQYQQLPQQQLQQQQMLQQPNQAAVASAGLAPLTPRGQQQQQQQQPPQTTRVQQLPSQVGITQAPLFAAPAPIFGASATRALSPGVSCAWSSGALSPPRATAALSGGSLQRATVVRQRSGPVGTGRRYNL